MIDPKDPIPADELTQQYETLTSAAGFVELSERSFVSMQGDDRRQLLHSFCTNEIKNLAEGQVCEAFVLNTKGKLLGFVHVAALDNELLLTGHGNQSKILIEHLDKYIIREDVELSDRSEELATIFVCGDQAAERMAQLCETLGGKLPELNRVVEGQLKGEGGIKFKIIQTELAGVGFLMICDSSDIASLKSVLANADIPECSVEAIDIVRVRKKTPWFGIDADDSNLPQELQRDEIAISFDKGCYLGQETVARIDAIGRVNQLLVGFKYTGESTGNSQPTIGAIVEDEKPAGKITSIAKLPASDSGAGNFIGLGYVRRKFKEPGTKLGQWVVL